MADKKLKVMWLCNLMPLFVAKSLGRKGTNKEGWIEGIASELSANDNIALAIAFPVKNEEPFKKTKDGVVFYGFAEDTDHPENYDSSIEAELGLICEDYNPDVIHVFGTEFPHSLAILKVSEWKEKVVVHIQGIVSECEKVYDAGIPQKVYNRVTFRDFIKRDSIKAQQEKYRSRAKNEDEVFRLATNVCGRTLFDENYTKEINPSIKYYNLNETLRKNFYGPVWNINECEPHSIFVSQGNYPLKGAHFVIEALARVKEKYSDAKVYIAGDKITANKTLKDKIKISSYGKYLLELIEKYHLEDSVIFTGNINAKNMLKQYMSSNVYVISSVIENSPNSLGEAMLIGMPCIAANVGGIPSLCDDRVEALFYDPYNTEQLLRNILLIFDNQDEAVEMGLRARERASRTHDGVANYRMLTWMYEDIAGWHKE